MTVTAAENTHQTLVTVGVDTHLDAHVAVALDELGRRLDELNFPTTKTGYDKFLKWTVKLGSLDRVGIEGAGAFGAGLARFLRERGTEVLEVGRPKRRDQHRSGKSDPIDAELAARAVLAGTAIGQTKGGDGQVEMIRVLILIKCVDGTITSCHTSTTQTRSAKVPKSYANSKSAIATLICSSG